MKGHAAVYGNFQAEMALHASTHQGQIDLLSVPVLSNRHQAC